MSRDAMTASLNAIKRAVDKAIAEGLTSMTQEEFGRRITAETEVK